MRWCAGTGCLTGDAPLGVLAARHREVGAVEEVRHRLRRVRARRARGGVVGQEQDAEGLVGQRVDERPDDVGVPALERRDLLVDRALVPGLVGGLDVQEEEVAVGERRQAASRCAT